MLDAMVAAASKQWSILVLLLMEHSSAAATNIQNVRMPVHHFPFMLFLYRHV